jgi:hypothetical protein
MILFCYACSAMPALVEIEIRRLRFRLLEKWNTWPSARTSFPWVSHGLRKILLSNVSLTSVIKRRNSFQVNLADVWMKLC